MNTDQLRDLATIKQAIMQTVPANEQPVAMAALNLIAHFIELAERFVVAHENKITIGGNVNAEQMNSAIMKVLRGMQPSGGSNKGF